MGMMVCSGRGSRRLRSITSEWEPFEAQVSKYRPWDEKEHRRFEAQHSQEYLCYMDSRYAEADWVTGAASVSVVERAPAAL